MGDPRVALRTLSVACRLLREGDPRPYCSQQTYVQGGRAGAEVFNVFSLDRFCSVLWSRSSKTWTKRRSSRFSHRKRWGSFDVGLVALFSDVTKLVQFSPGNQVFFYELHCIWRQSMEAFERISCVLHVIFDPDPEVDSPFAKNFKQFRREGELVQFMFLTGSP